MYPSGRKQTSRSKTSNDKMISSAKLQSLSSDQESVRVDSEPNRNDSRIIREAESSSWENRPTRNDSPIIREARIPKRKRLQSNRVQESQPSQLLPVEEVVDTEIHDLGNFLLLELMIMRLF